MTLYKILNFSFLFQPTNKKQICCSKTTQELSRGQTSILIHSPHRHRCHETEPTTLDHASLAYTSFSNLTKNTHKATDHHFASGSLVSKQRVFKWKPAEIPYAYYNFMSSRHTNCSLPDSQQPIQSYQMSSSSLALSFSVFSVQRRVTAYLLYANSLLDHSKDSKESLQSNTTNNEKEI